MLRGQTDSSHGEIHGLVSDPKGAGVPNATVTLRRPDIGLVRTASTNLDGTYRFLVVPPGIYEIEAEGKGFQSAVIRPVQATVGGIATVNVELQLAAIHETVVVKVAPELIEAGRSQQAETLMRETIAGLPIDRRDYLTFALLTPGVADAHTIADNTDLRAKALVQSGLSFAGSNGRGNSITVDGGEANNFTGGARSTLPQEGVEEFQVNQSNYSAELGGASGGAVNIVSRGGTNEWHGSAFDFLRHHSLDAGNPFARVLRDGDLVRIKPPSRRQQFGASLGGPIRKDKTFIFSSFEGLLRRESSVVSILTDYSIFGPTAEQKQVFQTLSPDRAAELSARLTASPETVALFERNSGVFPFATDSWQNATRLDHCRGDTDRYYFRYNFANFDESDANLQSLVGASRGTVVDQFDPTVAGGWTHLFRPRLINEGGLQWSYRRYNLRSIDPYGPELRITGFGVFNRDLSLPSRSIERRLEFRDNLTWATGAHTVKLGILVLVRGAHTETDIFFGGSFTFGELPGTLIDPALPANFRINALQAFNLGLASTYLQGTGDPTIASTQPSIGLYVQDSWQAASRLKIDYGLRYELDVRNPPVPTGRKNVAPRFGFAWNPDGASHTVVRGGYGIYYSPIYYHIDWITQALGYRDGKRRIVESLTTIQTPGPAAADNIYRTLLHQGVINIPVPTRTVAPEDVAQFGVTFPRSGPLPPFSVVYEVSPDFRNPYSQQASIGIEHRLARDLVVSAVYTRVFGLHLPRSRDINLLDSPIDPVLGIRVWSKPDHFVDPLLAQRDLYESTAISCYNGFSIEVRKQLNRRFSLAANYTLSSAKDETTDSTTAFQAADQRNLAAERAASSFDQRHKFVLYGSYTAPLGIAFSPIVYARSGRPFNMLAGLDLNQDRHSDTDRPAGAPRNSGLGPDFWTVDLRAGKKFSLSERGTVELTLEAFNLLNRLNLSSVNNVVGNMPGPFNVTGRDDRLPAQPLGFSSAFDPRRLQIGIRLSF